MTKRAVEIFKRSGYDGRQSIIERMLDDGIVLVNGPICPEASHLFYAQLTYISNADPNRLITVNINSPGGTVHDGLAMIDLCRRIPNPVATDGTGICASMGAAILVCAGDRGRRAATANCEIMMHQPIGGAQGQVTDLAIAAEHALGLRDRLYKMIAECSGQDIGKVARDYERDKWFTAEQARECGLIDEVLPDKKALLGRRQELRPA